MTFLIRAGLLAAGQGPADRVKPKAVRAYIEELRGQDLSSWTIWSRLVELHSAISAMAPGHDIGWLRRTARALRRQRVGRRDKLPRLRPAQEILDWALQRMAEIQGNPSSRTAAVVYRDTLIVAVLSCCPIRLANLAMIEIDRHLVLTGSEYMLRFAPEETKTHRPITIPVPDWLGEPISHYVTAMRPRLLASEPSKRLWISNGGMPMRERALHAAITRTTRRAFGTPINPHLFRDCAASFMALEDPEHVGIVAPLLGHVDPRTAERHYIHARQIAAVRSVRASVACLRRRLAATEPGSTT